MWSDVLKAFLSWWSDIWSADIAFMSTLPFAFVAGRKVLLDLSRNIRAKNALEERVLQVVRSDARARDAILSGTISGESLASGTVINATQIVTEAAATLEGEDAILVQRALEQGEHHGRADYIDDIARHVTAKMAHSR